MNCRNDALPVEQAAKRPTKPRDDYAWFAENLDLATGQPWDFDAGNRNRGICRDCPAPSERA